MRVVLAYSGGLDTSFCLRWLQEKYKAEVITLTLELGQRPKDLEAIKRRAERLGAVKTYSLDARKEFAEEYVSRAIKANACYEGKYPLSSALSRPLIAKHLVEIAEREKADAVAHGCTGKGNDQVRFEVSIRALNPELRVIAPIREHRIPRERSIAYLREFGLSFKEHKYSVDENLWGRSVEAGVLEDPAAEPPEDVFEWTKSPEEAKPEVEVIELGFESGLPTSINGEELELWELIAHLNELGGEHGIGRIDVVEDRVVGIKSREVYECPAATIILEAHRELERLVLTREELAFKRWVEEKWSQLVYFGQWYEPLRLALEAFVDETQRDVGGSVRLKLHKGNVWVVCRESPKSLYRKSLATYTEESEFDEKAAEGFIRLFGLQTELGWRRHAP